MLCHGRLCGQPESCCLGSHPGFPTCRILCSSMKASGPLSGVFLSHTSNPRPARAWHFPMHRMAQGQGLGTCRVSVLWGYAVGMYRLLSCSCNSLSEWVAEIQSSKDKCTRAMKSAGPFVRSQAGSFLANSCPSHPIPPFRGTNLTSNPGSHNNHPLRASLSGACVGFCRPQEAGSEMEIYVQEAFWEVFCGGGGEQDQARRSQAARRGGQDKRLQLAPRRVPELGQPCPGALAGAWELGLQPAPV